MAERLPSLEQRREQLFDELAKLGDFRPGTLSVNFRKCGRENCACAREEGHPGHGPQYLWSTTQKGKSRAQNLRLGPEIKKVEREIETYRRFTELCGELVEVSEQICKLRPVAGTMDERELSDQKKTLEKKYSRKSRKR
jgi:hypothetical protein